MKRPYYKKYPKDYLGETGHLTLEEHGFYNLLLDYLWINGGQMDKNRLQRILKISPKKFEKLFKNIAEFLEINGENFTQKRLSFELAKYNKMCEINQENIKRRYQKPTDGNTDGNTALLNQKPKTKNHKIKNKNNKTPYAEFVAMDESEFQKLVKAHGEPFTLECIRILDNYKGANGKKYKSDYRAILNWVIDRVKQNGFNPVQTETKKQFKVIKAI